MDHKARATFTIIGCVISLIGSVLVPWFVIVYNPPGSLPSNNIFNSNVFAFNALFLLPYSSDIDSLHTLFWGIGAIFVVGLLSLLKLHFLEKYVLKYVHWVPIG